MPAQAAFLAGCPAVGLTSPMDAIWLALTLTTIVTNPIVTVRGSTHCPSRQEHHYLLRVKHVGHRTILSRES